jgi:hypothetical protein
LWGLRVGARNDEQQTTMNNEQFMVNFVETDNYPSLQNFRIFRINKSEIYAQALKMVNGK